MTLKNEQVMEIERRHWIALPEEVTLEEAMDLLRDRR